MNTCIRVIYDNVPYTDSLDTRVRRDSARLSEEFPAVQACTVTLSRSVYIGEKRPRYHVLVKVLADQASYRCARRIRVERYGQEPATVLARAFLGIAALIVNAKPLEGPGGSPFGAAAAI
ncbi:MAG: hypothetical protein HYV16_01585 [Gammaproteobacteria bacterium]|nr:hypothetical protein [Gammaproteobacteria bacterium]